MLTLVVLGVVSSVVVCAFGARWSWGLAWPLMALAAMVCLPYLIGAVGLVVMTALIGAKAVVAAHFTWIAAPIGAAVVLLACYAKDGGASMFRRWKF